MISDINDAFSKCPNCKSHTYRRLDKRGGRDDGSFICFLISCLLLPFLPWVIFGLWNPSKDALLSLRFDHPTFFELLRYYLNVVSSCYWIAQALVWPWLVTSALAGTEFWKMFAGCTECDTALFRKKQLVPKSISSRIVVMLLKIANLRLLPRVKSVFERVTLVFGYSFIAWGVYIALYKLPILILFPGSLFLWLAYSVIFRNAVQAGVGALVTAFSLFLANTIWSGFLGVPVLVWLTWHFIEDNRKTQLDGIDSAACSKAMKPTLLRLPLLLLVLIPGLTFKAGVDWACFKALDAMEAGTSQLQSVGVPTLKAEKYPWTSPLYWMGVPRYRVVQTDISLKAPREGLFSVIGLARFLLGALEFLVLAFLVVLILRVLTGMFLRELIVNGLRLNAYLPVWNFKLPPVEDEERTIAEPDSASTGTFHCSETLSIHATLSLDKMWGRSVFLKRHLSPSGGVPSTELPAPTMALVGRSIHGLLIMDRYDIFRHTIRLDSTGGHRFVRWELGPRDIVCVSFNRLVGWTDTIQLGTSVCLQCGMLAQGKILVHPVRGPGSLIFDLHGEFGEHTPNESIVFQPDRLVGFRLDHESGDAHPEFSMNATGGTLNAFLGNIALHASPGSQLLLDPKGKDQDSNRPIMALLRHSYSIWG